MTDKASMSDDAHSDVPVFPLQLLPEVVLVLVCCECQRITGYREAEYKGVSHGYCDDCRERVLRETAATTPRA